MRLSKLNGFRETTIPLLLIKQRLRKSKDIEKIRKKSKESKRN
jgi:hypothetical protein